MAAFALCAGCGQQVDEELHFSADAKYADWLGKPVEFQFTAFDGRPVDSKQLHGKVVLLDFWATWCGPCLKAMPKLDVLARTHPDVVVIAINLDDAAAARTLWDERGYLIRLLADDGQVSERYGVSTIPHSVVIDRAGVVRMVARGNTAQLDATVRALLGEQIRK